MRYRAVREGDFSQVDLLEDEFQQEKDFSTSLAGTLLF